MHRNAAALVALMFTACAATPPLPTHLTPPEPLPPEPSPVPSRIVRVAPSGPPVVIARGDDGTVLLLAGGRRIERHGDEVRVAEQSSAARWRWALRANGRWRFGTDTTAYDADTFLGPLREVSTGGRPCRGVGRACVLRAGELPGIGLPVRGAVIDAAFVDEQRGAVVLEPGLAFATEDGGASWWPVQLLDDAAMAVVADETGVWVRGVRAGAEVLAGGGARPTLAERVPWPAGSLDARDQAAAASAMTDDPAGWLWTAARDGARDGDAVMIPAHGRFARYDLRTESFAFAGPERCENAVFVPGNTLAVRCRDGQTTALYAPDANGRWTARLTLADPEALCRASSDGTWVGCTGGCAPDPPSASRVCEREGESPQRSATLAHGTLLGYDDEGARWSLAVSAPREAGALVALDSVWPVRDERVLATLATAVSEHDARAAFVPWPALGAGGVLQLPVRVGASGPRGVLEGRPGGTLVFHPAPASSSWVGAAAGRAVLSFGRATGWMQYGDPPGDFQGVPVLDESAARVLAAGPDARVAACSQAGCVLDADRARIGWGPAALSRWSAVGEGDATVSPDIPATAPWTCRRDGFAMRVPDLEGWYGMPGDGTQVHEGPLGSLVVRERPAGRNAGVMVEASWYASGDSARESTARFTLARYGARESTRWSALDLGTARAVLVRCGAGPGGVAPGCDVLRVTAGRTSPPPELLATVATPPALHARADGAFALLTERSPEAGTEMPGDARELVFSPRFVSARTVAVALARGAPGAAGVYVLDGEAGVARRMSDGTVVLAPAGGIPRALPSGTSGAACGSFARGEIALPEPGVLDLGELGTREMDLVVRYGVEQGALCRRGLDGSVRQLGESGWIFARPVGDVLRGTARTRGQITPVRCEPPVGVQR